MTPPAVDVVIAARNEERYIRACLESLQAQDYPADRLQIHVIDNGSRDETARIAEQCGVHLLHERKRGPAAARNAGLSQSEGELVSFLDAHCILERNWIRSMVGGFDSPEVGGCQGSMENRAINARVQKYLDASGELSNERVVINTVSGKRNLYPWILSGNCMYRREALNEAGSFNEELEACEDVDLAWRVVLLGYQLRYVPQAKLIHYNCDSWGRFVGKAFSYGRGAAAVASTYKPHGAREKFAPGEIWSTRPERLLSALCYWAGYRKKELQLRFNHESRGADRPGRVLAKFRKPFQWTPDVTLRVSDESIFWFRDEDQTTVIVHLPAKLRIVLDSAGDFICRRITDGIGRDSVIHELMTHYGVARVTASADLDDFVEDLVATGILLR
jgi:cellulose synthase/poly-beta-1,6-N-acetylglucosamine synthase-like glycosyltransferase